MITIAHKGNTACIELDALPIKSPNTSTLYLDAIAEVTSRPQDVIGLHFFSPANIMRLLEIVRSARTAPDVIATAIKVAKKIRKLPFTVGVCYGFVGNRLLEPYFREGSRLLLEGATPKQVDDVLERFGMAMGIHAMADLAAHHGVTQCSIDDQEILERCLFPLINEGFLILEEGIATRPGDCDLIWVNGYGFPNWRGGPMHYADEVGLGHILDRMQHYQRALGDYGEMWFTPASLLEKLVAQGITLAEHFSA